VADEFAIDPKNKLGGDVDWDNGGEFDAFVDSLNRGGVGIRGSNGVSGLAESTDDVSLDEASLLRLKSLFLNYR
jgi:hypothetical protein